MAKRKKSKRTVMYSRGGKKLYAVRDKGGKFKDIQSYARSHAADLRRKSKGEAAKPTAAKKSRKKAKKKVAAKKAAAPRRVAAAKKAAPRRKAAAPAKAPARRKAAAPAPGKPAPRKPAPRKPAVARSLPVSAETAPGPAIPPEVAAEVPPAGE